MRKTIPTIITMLQLLLGACSQNRNRLSYFDRHLPDDERFSLRCLDRTPHHWNIYSDGAVETAYGIPLEPGEQLHYRTFNGDKDTVAVVELSFGGRYVLKVFGAADGKPRFVSPCPWVYGRAIRSSFFVKKYNQDTESDVISKFDLKTGGHEVVGEIPKLKYLASDPEFYIDESERIFCAPLYDYYSYREDFMRSSFIVYDMAEKKVLAEMDGRLLQNNPFAEEENVLLFSEGQSLQAFDLRTLSSSPVNVENMTLRKNQTITMLKRNGSFALVEVTTVKRWSVERIVAALVLLDYPKWTARGEYFFAEYDGASLAIKCRAKDIDGMNLFEMRLPETERR